MKLKNYAKREAEVLDWVNRVRKLYGRDPLFVLPSGKKRDFYSCPVARGLGPGMYVNCDEYGEAIAREDWIKKWSHPTPIKPILHRIGSLPVHVARFVADFDADEFPWLEKSL